MELRIFLFLFWVALLQMPSDAAHPTETLGELSFTCKDGWSINNTKCYYHVDVAMTYEDAESTCERQGGHLLQFDDNDLEEYSFVQELTDKDIWLHVPDEKEKMFGLWGYYQPNDEMGQCVSISKQDWARKGNCVDWKTFVCKYEACREGYTPCTAGGKCIRDEYLCDNVFDCPDQSDELSCPDKCRYHMMLDEETGTFINPVQSYFKSCSWILEAPIGSRLQLHTPDIDLETNQATLAVYTGKPTIIDARLISSKTGSIPKTTFYSDHNVLILTLETSYVSRQVPRVTFAWTIGIPGIHVGLETINLLSYTPAELYLEYPFNTQIGGAQYWLIQAEDNEVITFLISGLDSNEPRTFMLYRDGDDGSFGHVIRPGQIATTGTNKLYVKMVSRHYDGPIQLVYQAGCTVTNTRPTANILSPGYTLKKIPNLLRCDYTLTGGSANQRGASLKFLELDTDTQTTTFEVYTDNSTSPAVLVKQYDDNTDNIIYAEQGLIRIVLTTDEITNSDSFNIEYGMDCIYLGEQGILKLNYNVQSPIACNVGFALNAEYVNMTEPTFTCRVPGGNCELGCDLVHCGAPPAISNGFLKSTNGTTYQGTAVYQCNEGFTLKSTAQPPNCAADGKWQDIPMCTSTQCQIGDGTFSLDNGQSNAYKDPISLIPGDTAGYGVVVEFTCNEGFHLQGPHFTRCKDGSWSHVSANQPPACKPNVCNIPVSATMDSTTPNCIPYDQSETIRCKTGFQVHDTTLASSEVTCQANGTLSDTIICVDINECEVSLVCPSSSTCENTIGSFVCKCNRGFKKDNSGQCADIDECATELSCNQECENKDGTYKCICDTGYELVDGFCVRKSCGLLPSITDGQYQSVNVGTSGYKFGDSVKMRCNDGYHIAGAVQTRVEADIECTDTGFTDIKTCSARTCTVPIPPQYGTLDKTGSINFGEKVTLECTLSSTDTTSLTAYCIFEDGNVLLKGEDITTCPEIDCGVPVSPPGSVVPSPASSKHMSPEATFTFGCQTGFEITGSSGSEDGDTVVACKANGRWQFGSLSCVGKTCPDPGTPADAVQQATNYEVGRNISYTCKRAGFLPDGMPPEEYQCVNPEAPTWNTQNLPKCKDAEPPTALNCPTDPTAWPKYVEHMGKLVFDVPDFKDNFAIMSETKNSDYGPNDWIFAPISVTYTGSDFEGLSKTCQYDFRLIDRSSRPPLDCPNFLEVTVSDTQIKNVDLASDVSSLDSSVSISIAPEDVSGSPSRIGERDTIIVTAQDEHGTESMCTFLVEYEAGACFADKIHDDANADRNCSDEFGPTVSCTSTCKNGFVYGNGDFSKTFQCSENSGFSFGHSQYDYCLPYQFPQYQVEVTVVYQIAFLSANCLDEFNTTLNANNLQSKIDAICTDNWELTVQYPVEIPASQLSDFKVKFKLFRESESVAASSCLDSLTTVTFDFVDNLFCDGAARQIRVSDVSTGDPDTLCASIDTGKITAEELGSVCVPCRPGTYFNAAQCAVCPPNKYQDENNQRDCKSCPSNSQPNDDQTGCIASCPQGFQSGDGLAPCSPCEVDTYWTSSTSCTSCLEGYSTLGVIGVDSQSKCYAPCAQGEYSLTGFNNTECVKCPQGSHQQQTGSTFCNRCPGNETTNNIGTTSSNDCVPLTGCTKSYCNDHGSCVYRLNRKHCTCDEGFSGDQCQKAHHICDGNPCTNGGTCIKGDGYKTYTCECRTDLDTMTLVSDGDSAASTGTDYKQLTGLTVAQCETQCLNDRICLSFVHLDFGANSNICNLNNVSLSIDELATVSATANVFNRVRAFSGDDCEVYENKHCGDAGCHNDSMCMEKIGEAVCLCPSGGLTGSKCDESTDRCSPNLCVHGSCASFSNVRFECTCDAGWQGAVCDEDIDECQYFGVTCLYGGNCTNQENDYFCQCESGFSGQFCQNTPDFCLGRDCQDSDVCYSSLQQKQGICYCDSLLYEDVTTENGGNTCRRIDSCNSTELTGICGQYGDCEDRAETYVCNCVPGVTGEFCNHNINDCSSNSCNGHGYCMDKVASFECICDEGYTGVNCDTLVNECDRNPCVNGSCQNVLYGYTCECFQGFTGLNCEAEIDMCDSCPCENSGTCKKLDNDYECTCPMLFTGRNCETPIKSCSSNPCKNGSPCFNLDNDNYFCKCAGGTQGSQCEALFDVCDVLANETLCENGGVCVNKAGTAKCVCPKDHNLEYCYFEQVQDEAFGGGSDVEPGVYTEEGCKDSCFQDEMCDSVSVHTVLEAVLCFKYKIGEANVVQQDSFTHFQKICPTVHTGVACEITRTHCLSNPCENGGTCQDKCTSYRCNCAPGYSGARCQITVYPCASSPCAGSATCRSYLDEYVCQCPKGDVYNGNGCVTTASDYLILVNTLTSNMAPAPALQSPFYLQGDSLSLMMWFRVLQYADDAVLATLIAQDSIHPEDNFNAAQGLQIQINNTGLLVKYKGIEKFFSFDQAIFDDEWHIIGVSISADDLFWTIDAITTNTEMGLGPEITKLDFPHYTQLILGKNMIAQIANTTVWNKTLPSADFIQAYQDKEVPQQEYIAQCWCNYRIPQGSVISTKENPYFPPAKEREISPPIKCDAIQSPVYYLPDKDLVNIRDLGEVVANINAFKEQMGSSLDFKQTLPPVMTYGTYRAVLVRTDANSNYDSCKFYVFIRYNEVCPNPRYSGWRYDSCSNNDGICDPKCENSALRLSAKFPRYKPCPSWGVYNNEMPHQLLVLPPCGVPSSPKYAVKVSLKIVLQINCEMQFVSQIERRIEEHFESLSATWSDFCVKSTQPDGPCTNLYMDESATCDQSSKNVEVVFEIAFNSPTINRVGQTGQVPVEDVIDGIILQNDSELDLNQVAGAQISNETQISVSPQCMQPGSTLLMDSDDQMICVPCGEGFYVDNTGMCVPCAPGTYQDQLAQSSCKSCNDTQTTYQHGSRAQSECKEKCQPGSHFNEQADQCEPCPRNRYQDMSGQNHCVACPIGYRTIGNGSSDLSDCKVDCPGGQYRNEDEVCTVCPRGQWRSLDFDNCQDCPEGKVTMENVLADSEDKCNMDNCTLGQFWNQTNKSCMPCPVDTYGDTLYIIECRPCQPNYSTISEGSKTEDSCKFYCGAGAEETGEETCTPCPRNKYKTQDMKFDVCADCDGMTTEGTGSKFAENCSIPVCTAGQFIQDGECTDCPLDTYSDVELPNSATQCQECTDPCDICAVVYGTEQEKSVSDEQCKATCPGGEEFDDATGECVLCPTDKFKPASERFGKCQDCPNNKVSADFGATDAANCTITNCEPGYKIVEDICEPCPVGTYQDSWRQSDCIPCGENLSTASNGTASAEECQISCGPGFFGQDTCVQCPAHQYKPEQGYDSCKDCPPGTTSPTNRTACTLTFCYYGQKYNADTESCVDCPEGSYKDSKGNSPLCQTCPLGTTTDGPGQRNCSLLNCVPGEYVLNGTCEPCMKGTYKSETGNAACTDCPSQSTTTGPGATDENQCDTIVCPPGSYRESSQKTMCTECPFNTFQNISGNTACINCPDGQVTMQKQSTSEDQCVPLCTTGTAYNQTSQTCYNCPRGTYKSVANNSVDCTSCPVGKTTLGQQSTSENDCSQVMCPEGTFGRAETSRIVCIPCPLGTYNDQVMQEMCPSCSTPSNKRTTLATGRISAVECIPDCTFGHGYSTVSRTCKICDVNFLRNTTGTFADTCVRCPSRFTNLVSGSNSCQLQDTEPVEPKEQRATVRIDATYQVNVDDCGSFEVMSETGRIIWTQVDSKVKDIYSTEGMKFTNSWCHEPACGNVGVSYISCSASRRRRKKRALLDAVYQVTFQNVSNMVSDIQTNTFVPTAEILTRIMLTEKANFSIPGQIVFVDYSNVQVFEVCQPGQYRNGNLCEFCPIGTFSTDGESANCTVCGLNSYQDETGQPLCKLCEPPRYTDSPGSSSLDECKSPCAAGTAYNSTSMDCYDCPKGTFKSSVSNSAGCTACPDGTTTLAAASTASSDCSTIVCPVGTSAQPVDSSVTCVPCPVGTYNDQANAATCTNCSTSSNQRTTHGIGSFSSVDCKPVCSSGSGYNTTLRSCETCRPNFFNNQDGSFPNTCKRCNAGQTNINSGSTSCPITPTDPQPVTRRVTIVLIAVYQFNVDSCDTLNTNQGTGQTIRGQIRNQFVQVFQTIAQNFIDSWCSVAGCPNLGIEYDDCSLSAAGRRRKRALASADYRVSFKNVSDTVTDKDSNDRLSTDEILAQILETERRNLDVEGGITFASYNNLQITDLCTPGQYKSGTQCVDCATGSYNIDGVGDSCTPCSNNTYQDQTGQASCKQCEGFKYLDQTGSSSPAACQFLCQAIPNYCNNRGECKDIGVKEASCSCYSDFSGDRCETKKERTSDLAPILGAAIGGGGGLLIAILIIVGVYRCLMTRKEAPKRPPYPQEEEYIYDNRHPPMISPGSLHSQKLPAIGYPAPGFRQEPHVDEVAYGTVYRPTPSVPGDQHDDGSPTYMWSA